MDVCSLVLVFAEFRTVSLSPIVAARTLSFLRPVWRLFRGICSTSTVCRQVCLSAAAAWNVVVVCDDVPAVAVSLFESCHRSFVFGWRRCCACVDITVTILPIHCYDEGRFLSRVSILLLTRDIDIVILSVRPSVRLSVRPSVRDTLVLYENGLTYRHSFSTIR